MEKNAAIRPDIASSVFQVHGVDAHDNAVLRGQLKRRQVLAYFKKLPFLFEH